MSGSGRPSTCGSPEAETTWQCVTYMLRLLTVTDRQFGHVVKRIRKRAGLSLREVSVRCGISAMHISRVERGVVSPTLGVMNQLAAGLDHVLDARVRPRRER